MRILFPRQRNGFLHSQQISFLIEEDVLFCARERPVCAADVSLASNVVTIFACCTFEQRKLQRVIFSAYLSYCKLKTLFQINNQLIFDKRNYKIRNMQSNFAVSKHLHTVASDWILLIYISSLYSSWDLSDARKRSGRHYSDPLTS